VVEFMIADLPYDSRRRQRRAGARYVVVSAFRFSRKNVCNRSMQRAASTPELTSTL